MADGQEITDGEVALYLVLEIMRELGEAKALSPKMLKGIMAGAIDLSKSHPARLHRLRSYDRRWGQSNPPSDG